MYSIKAHAKINIFLKITGHENGYHTLLSRFMRLSNLYDTISFVPCKCDSFTIEGMDEIDTNSNTIYKAFVALNDHTGNLDLLDFFQHHKVVVEKNIPSLAGLGGGSSDAGAFLRLANKICNLQIDIPTLADIGSNVGADVPFFVYDYPMANVRGFGEIIEPFYEEPFEVELFFPAIGCNTTKVYNTFKSDLLCNITPEKYMHWANLNSKDIIAEACNNPEILNDLFGAALLAYPDLSKEAPKGWLFSGSGSTFFKPYDIISSKKGL
ncbi:MAG: 4-(cytidine 5'-diphospho)-2-C-methyl-D-erythritol kinase [Sulfurovaceae bacterium]|nr:4-(cytidine 5'-diphospho)-2-C-methyl-D-erythritol kinase [Sulfurovaceae bacterium]